MAHGIRSLLWLGLAFGLALFDLSVEAASASAEVRVTMRVVPAVTFAGNGAAPNAAVYAVRAAPASGVSLSGVRYRDVVQATVRRVDKRGDASTTVTVVKVLP